MKAASRRTFFLSFVCALTSGSAFALTGCGGDEASGGGGGKDDSNSPGEGAATDPVVGRDSRPDLETPDSFSDEDLIGNFGDGAGGKDTPGADCKTLPQTLVKYCTRASPPCLEAGASCPLFVVHNTDSPFGWLEDTSKGPMVVTRGFGTSDGNAVKHWVAEIAVTVKKEYPGIDPKRVFFVGWSHGAGAAYRGICHRSKGLGITPFGINGDIYAGIAAAGGCPNCSDQWKPSGKFHAISVNGEEDIFGGEDSCEGALRNLAALSECSSPSGGQWQNVEASDPYMQGGKGSDGARALHFGDCPFGSVAGYRFRDEGHKLTFGKHFDPKVRAMDIIWNFLKDKSK